MRRPPIPIRRIRALASILTFACAFTGSHAESLIVSTSQVFPADSVLDYDEVTLEPGATLTLGGGTVLTITGMLTLADGAVIVCHGRNTTAQVDGAWAGSGVTISAGASAGSPRDGTLLFADTSLANWHVRLFQRWRLDADTATIYGRLTLDDAAVLELGGGASLHIEGACDILGGSTVIAEGRDTTAQVNDTWAGVGVFVRAGSFNVETGSVVTGDGRGYVNGKGPGAPANSGDYNAGASHGGIGGGPAGGGDRSTRR